MNKDRLINIFLTLARTDSPSLKEKKVRDVILGYLKALDLPFYEDNAGEKVGGECGNIICKIKGSENGTPIAFFSHMDTVEPSTNKEPILNGDVIETNGKTILGGDDHAGVALMLELLHHLKENPVNKGDITFVFTIAEEIGLLGAKNLDIDQLDAKFGFVLDNGGEIGTFSVKAPYHNSLLIEVFGKASHAGVEPENGVSAIQIFSHAVSQMRLGRVSPDTTANIGVIEGGSARNIICDYCKAKGEARSLDEEELILQTKHMEDCFMKGAKKFGGEISFQVVREYDGFEIDENHDICKILRNASKGLGIEVIPEKSGGGSDTNVFNKNGLPSVNLSVGMEKVHSTKEVLNVEELFKASKFALEIIKSI